MAPFAFPAIEFSDDWGQSLNGGPSTAIQEAVSSAVLQRRFKIACHCFATVLQLLSSARTAWNTLLNNRVQLQSSGTTSRSQI